MQADAPLWVHERVIELFAGKFDMNVDVIDPSPQMSLYLLANFPEVSEIILSHQSIDPANWPLHERFSIAVRLEGHTPLDFQRTVGLPTIGQVGQLHDAHMGTALHWAAKEWYGGWWYRRDIYKDLEKFILALLESKPLIHALDRRGMTPLMCALDIGTYPNQGERSWISFNTPSGDFAAATEGWGRLLSNAGVSLPGYVARENALLAANASGDCICLTAAWSKIVILSRLVLSEQQLLRLEVTFGTDLDIWEFRPPPGLLLNACEDCPTIFWQPTEDDGDQVCWQNTSSRILRSKPFEWTRHHGANSDVSSAECDIFKDLFVTSNDDHSALALLLGRNRQSRAQQRCHRPRRSSSMPPLRNAYVHSRDPYELMLYKFGFRLPRGTVIPYLHKCLLDSRWGFHVQAQPQAGGHSWRACMKGCQGRTDYASMFEEFLAYTVSEPKRIARELQRLEGIVETV